MKIKKTFLFLALSFYFTISFGQQINLLGTWVNNANFATGYYHERLIVSTTSGLKILNVSNPNNPILSSTTSAPFWSTTVEIDGDFAYFRGGMAEKFMICDISNIDNPTIKGIISISGGGQISIKDNYAYLPTSLDTLYCVDISDKMSPIVINKLGVKGTGISIVGNYAYLSSNVGLKVLDISDPYNIAIVNTLSGNYSGLAKDTLSNRLFAGSNASGFDVIDISTPNNPSILFSGIGGTSFGSVYFKNNYVFQPYNSGISVFQIGSSSANYLASYNITSGQITSITAKDSIFYVSTNNNVQVFKIGDPVTTNVDMLSRFKSTEIFPNPAGNFIKIKTSNDLENSTATIFSDIGQVIRKINLSYSNEITLDIFNLKAGLYYLEITYNNNIERLKFIKE